MISFMMKVQKLLENMTTIGIYKCFAWFFLFSLHSNSQLDINIKGGMIKDLLNLAGFMIPNKSDLTGAYSAPEPG